MTSRYFQYLIEVLIITHGYSSLLMALHNTITSLRICLAVTNIYSLPLFNAFFIYSADFT